MIFCTHTMKKMGIDKLKNVNNQTFMIISLAPLNDAITYIYCISANTLFEGWIYPPGGKCKNHQSNNGDREPRHLPGLESMIFEPKIRCTVVHVMREPDTIKRIKTMNQFVTNVSMARMLWLGRGSKRMKIKITVNLGCIFANEIRLTKRKKSWKCPGFEFGVLFMAFFGQSGQVSLLFVAFWN